MVRVRKLRIGDVGASLGIAALVISFSAPAWSQVDEIYTLSSNISDRFESGEFGEPLGEVRPQSTLQAALVNAPRPQYVYYVVPCDIPGAIRAGSPRTLDPGGPDARALDSAETMPSGKENPDENVCVALVDENRTDRTPLLYTYDSSYRYPGGYPSHHQFETYSRTYASTINVGYSSSRRYSSLRYGFAHYGRYPYGLRHSGGFPYGMAHYGAHSYGSHYGYLYGPFPYGAYPYISPYASQHFGFGFSVGHYRRRHYGARHYHIRYGRLGH